MARINAQSVASRPPARKFTTINVLPTHHILYGLPQNTDFQFEVVYPVF